MAALRLATTQDGEAVAALVGEVLAEYGMSLDLAGIDSDLADIDSSYIRSGGCFFVLEDEAARVIGSAGLMLIGDRVGELRKMYLARHARGQGWGKRLLRLILDEARRRRFRRVVLDTASVLKEAAQLYAAHGFEPTPVAHPSARCDRAYALDLEPIG